MDASPPSVGLGKRMQLIAVAWAVAYVITIAGEGPATILGLPWFPLGLCDLLRITSNETAAAISMLSWFAYLLLAFGVLAAKRPTALYAIWAALFVLLAATAVGCHSTFDHVRHSNMRVP